MSPHSHWTVAWAAYSAPRAAYAAPPPLCSHPAPSHKSAARRAMRRPASYVRCEARSSTRVEGAYRVVMCGLWTSPLMQRRACMHVRGYGTVRYGICTSTNPVHPVRCRRMMASPLVKGIHKGLNVTAAGSHQRVGHRAGLPAQRRQPRHGTNSTI